MTSRVLPREEWDRLAGTELAAVLAAAQHANAEMIVLIVEDGEQVVGCWALLQCWHAEGLWVAPAHRGKAAVARRLLRLAASVAEQIGFRSVCTAALTPDVTKMLDAVATRLEGQHYVLRLTDRVPKEELCRPLSPFH
jgi:N-acetylglutamate synthase-like GNAT family acetyltransferase